VALVRKRTTWPSDRRLSAKLVSTYVDRGCHVVSALDPHSHSTRFPRPGAATILFINITLCRWSHKMLLCDTQQNASHEDCCTTVVLFVYMALQTRIVLSNLMAELPVWQLFYFVRTWLWSWSRWVIVPQIILNCLHKMIHLDPGLFFNKYQ
jgi:hypothetical protein